MIISDNVIIFQCTIKKTKREQFVYVLLWIDRDEQRIRGISRHMTNSFQLLLKVWNGFFILLSGVFLFLVLGITFVSCNILFVWSISS